MSSPGTTKAARQLTHSASSAVASAAAATPMLPHTPLTASAWPARSWNPITIAVATGW